MHTKLSVIQDGERLEIYIDREGYEHAAASLTSEQVVWLRDLLDTFLQEEGIDDGTIHVECPWA